MIRRILVLVVGLVMAGVVLAPAAQAQYLPGQPGFIITPSELPDTGGRATINGFGCPPDEVVNAYLLDPRNGEVFIGSGRSEDGPSGAFDFEVNVPPLPAGEYTVIVRCGSVTLSNLLSIVATPAPVTAQQGSLPRTGGDPIPWVRIGLVLVTVGGLLAYGARKRRRAFA